MDLYDIVGDVVADGLDLRLVAPMPLHWIRWMGSSSWDHWRSQALRCRSLPLPDGDLTADVETRHEVEKIAGRAVDLNTQGYPCVEALKSQCHELYFSNV